MVAAIAAAKPPMSQPSDTAQGPWNYARLLLLQGPARCSSVASPSGTASFNSSYLISTPPSILAQKDAHHPTIYINCQHPEFLTTSPLSRYSAPLFTQLSKATREHTTQPHSAHSRKHTLDDCDNNPSGLDHGGRSRTGRAAKG